MSKVVVSITTESAINDEIKLLLLDAVDTCSVDSQVTITSQPVVNGDLIADHMYKEPKTMSVSGSFSLNGSKDSALYSEGKNNLESIQSLFEQIMHEGILCTVQKYAPDDALNIRFLQREHMCLESIRWTEKINTVDYTFSFKQVMVATVIIPKADVTDENLPAITEPITASFASTLFSKDDLIKIVVPMLSNKGLIEQRFAEDYAASDRTFAYAVGACITGGAILSVAVATAVAGAVTAATTTAAVSAAFGPVGWIVAGAALIIGGIIVAGATIAEKHSAKRELKQYKVAMFKYSPNEAENEAEKERFDDFLNQLYSSFNTLESVLHLYRIATNEPQECMLTIDDDYYVFRFVKDDNLTGKYSMSITDQEGKNVGTKMMDISAAYESFGTGNGITSSNYQLKTFNGIRVYLMNPYEDKTDLTNYFIAVCEFNPDDFSDMITDIISSAIYEDYKGSKS